jgi:methyltransferase (TIGR00027 family)
LIILGAGYDTRPVRLPELLKIDCFEVDQPELHELKTYGYDALGLKEEERAHLHLVAVDFNKDSVLKVAEHKNFKKGAKSVVLFEGVSQYIPETSTAETLGHLKELVGPGSILGISYVDEATYGSDEEIKEKICDDPASIHLLLSRIPKNEPWITGWSNASFATFMEKLSFKVVDDVTVEDFEERYFAKVGRTAKPFFRTERYATAELQ